MKPCKAGVVELDTTKPQWEGEAGEGRTLLVWQCSSSGDAIMLARLAPLAVARGLRMILCALPTVVRLMGCIPGVEVVVQSEDLPAFDFCCNDSAATSGTCRLHWA